MRTKLKGILIGALLGSTLTAASGAVYASGMDIEFIEKRVHYIFNGTSKALDDGFSFTYNDTTYVPLRFIAEALGKKVWWEEDRNTVTISISDPPAVIPVAVYRDKDKTYPITSKMVDDQLKLDLLFHPSNAAYSQDQEFHRKMQNLAAAQLLVADRVTEEQKQAAATQATGQLKKIKQQFANGYGEAYWDTFTQNYELTDAQITGYYTNMLLINDYAKRSITEEDIKAKYEKVKLQYSKAVWQQIYIQALGENGAVRSMAEARSRALEVQAKWKNGADFTELAAEYSDDRSLKQDKGVHKASSLANTGISDLLLKQEIGAVGEPYANSGITGWYIIRVLERTVPSLEELRDKLTSELQKNAFQVWVDKELSKLKVTLPDTELPSF